MLSLQMCHILYTISILNVALLPALKTALNKPETNQIHCIYKPNNNVVAPQTAELACKANIYTKRGKMYTKTRQKKYIQLIFK